MLKKRVVLLLMLLTLLFALALPTSARRSSCSGDDCGCGIAAQECRDSCAGNLACVRSCNRESIACAKACCAF